jgi:FtsP/CotA-like multicopper oxidase with cupredoxin domain
MQGVLPFPVDKTYMGAADTAASPNNTDNRTSVHLHGGNTPWISDGTPRQWFKPKGEANPNKGVSSSNVPDMWFDASGNLLPTCQGTATCATPGATNNPGDGASTFFFTNQQSQRLMFYHDHAEGTTRLNVYGGMAAGYVLQDPTEKAMSTVGGGQVTVTDPVTGASNFVNYNQVLPPLADTIPLVIQEKTFVPDNTTPVLNFFGAFKSQLNSQDPTWNWGVNYGTTPAVTPMASDGVTPLWTTTTAGTGDLWIPHVYMTNQNPGDTTGANSLGRWDYGPWFWPPATGLVHGPMVNAYYDSTCVSSAANICESQYVPGMPGNISATPEAFNDTPVVNGTAYPYMTIDPKKYRLRLLSVGNDRMLNLSLVVAASKLSPDTTAAGNAAPANNTILCDGTTAALPADCTEVKMVPFNDAQNTANAFPAWWYTYQKGGVTFDGRPSGVFDPATRGPAMVQVGTEGGFLSTPAVIRNQPVNFEYNLKNIVVTNVKEHALLLGPAERADVVVDFSQFAGSTILLYNDSPAPVPAFDLRLDYFTGNPDNTDTGGAFSTVPGYGPNTRTIMQFRVNPTCTTTNCDNGINRTHAVAASTHQDDVDPVMVVANNQAAYGANTATGGTLVAAVQQAFKYSQDPVIVPQAAYNRVYGTSVADAMSGNISKISDTALTFKPLADSFTGALEATAVTLGQGPKGIQELFTMDYGRMNALLSTEIPNTSATIQTTIPYYYVDAPTELVKISPNNGSPVTGAVGIDPVNSQMDDGTQLWKITHNGVDTHAVHFHLFNVQIINRVGWDGMVRNTELNELGWKDTVRMSPLEDVIVALRPKKMLDSTDLHALYPTEANIAGMDFQVPNSHRLLDPSQGTGPDANFYQLDPLTGNASTESNQVMNFGWEYVWHCHILGHEENDMMRTISVAQQPDAPALTALTGTGVAVATNGSASGPINVNWNDLSMVTNWVTIQRDTTTTFNSANLATFNVVEPE